MNNYFLVHNSLSDGILIENDLFLSHFWVFGMNGISLISFVISCNGVGW